MCVCVCVRVCVCVCVCVCVNVCVCCLQVGSQSCELKRSPPCQTRSPSPPQTFCFSPVFDWFVFCLVIECAFACFCVCVQTHRACSSHRHPSMRHMHLMSSFRIRRRRLSFWLQCRLRIVLARLWMENTSHPSGTRNTPKPASKCHRSTPPTPGGLPRPCRLRHPEAIHSSTCMTSFMPTTYASVPERSIGCDGPALDVPSIHIHSIRVLLGV
jgi:hypothetical protein